MDDAKKKTTVYLAGKITGDPCYKAKFRKAAEKLEAEGFVVLNPATLPDSGFTYEAYIRMSSAMLIECDALCLLEDWKDSEGAMLEYGRATARGMDIFHFDQWMEAYSIFSKEKTGKIALCCFSCGKISVYHENMADGRSCAHCGGGTWSVGHAKAEVEVNAP